MPEPNWSDLPNQPPTTAEMAAESLTPPRPEPSAVVDLGHLRNRHNMNDTRDVETEIKLDSPSPSVVGRPGLADVRASRDSRTERGLAIPPELRNLIVTTGTDDNVSRLRSDLAIVALPSRGVGVSARSIPVVHLDPYSHSSVKPADCDCPNCEPTSFPMVPTQEVPSAPPPATMFYASGFPVAFQPSQTTIWNIPWPAPDGGILLQAQPPQAQRRRNCLQDLYELFQRWKATPENQRAALNDELRNTVSRCRSLSQELSSLLTFEIPKAAYPAWAEFFRRINCGINFKYEEVLGQDATERELLFPFWGVSYPPGMQPSGWLHTYILAIILTITGQIVEMREARSAGELFKNRSSN